MKFLLISQFFHPESGASQKRLLEMCRFLKTQGHEIDVVTALPNYPKGQVYDGFTGKLSVTKEFHGIKIKHLYIAASSSKNPTRRMWSTLTFSFSLAINGLKSIGKKYDYTIVETPPPNIALLSVFLSKRIYKSKLIVNASDIWPSALFDIGVLTPKSLMGKLLMRTERYVYRKAHACVGQSEGIVNHIKKLSNATTLLYSNSVDTSDFFYTTQYNPTEKIRLVYAGLLGLAQHVSEFIKNIPFGDLGFELHLYGSGPDCKEIERTIVNRSDIVYHGFKSQTEISELVGSFDMAFIPMRHYIRGTVPAKTYEAMASALPIVMSASGEAASLVASNKIGWVSDPGDYHSLIDNLKSIKQVDKQSVSDMKIRARKLAESTYNRSFQNEKLEKFIDEL